MQIPEKENFIINLDTREITIPDCFDSLVGAFGDHGAETVFFELSGLTFDGKDLKTTQPQVAFVNANRQGYLRDIDWDGDKVAWPLSGNACAAPGELTFSIRFYIEKDGKCDYCLATRPCTVNIVPSVNIITDSDAFSDDDIYISDIMEILTEAVGIAEQIGEDRKKAEDAADLAEDYAVGENNYSAKYYSEQAKEFADSARTAADNASIAVGEAQNLASKAEESANAADSAQQAAKGYADQLENAMIINEDGTYVKYSDIKVDIAENAAPIVEAAALNNYVRYLDNTPYNIAVGDISLNRDELGTINSVWDYITGLNRKVSTVGWISKGLAYENQISYLDLLKQSKIFVSHEFEDEGTYLVILNFSIRANSTLKDYTIGVAPMASFDTEDIARKRISEIGNQYAHQLITVIDTRVSGNKLHLFAIKDNVQESDLSKIIDLRSSATFLQLN